MEVHARHMHDKKLHKKDKIKNTYKINIMSYWNIYQYYIIINMTREAHTYLKNLNKTKFIQNLIYNNSTIKLFGW
jgi:hypothetical protein